MLQDFNISQKLKSSGVMAEIKKKEGKNKGICHALTLEQQRAFLNYVANSPVYVHWLPLFTALFGTGCRIGEMLGLRWEDIDYANKTISINHTAYTGLWKTEKVNFTFLLQKLKQG